MIFQSVLTCAVLAALAGCASGKGIALSPKLKDLHLAATLGLDADTVLLNHSHFRNMLASLRTDDIQAEKTTVCNFESPYGVCVLRF